jgi:uncharacterized protein (TIGR01319 family)
MERIVRAKGLDKTEKLVDNIIMPTPMAVLKGAELLSVGIDGEPGMGDLMVVDIGGATTDVHSIADGYPKSDNVCKKGLPEPFAKRTVEGDLGLRVNALSIFETAGAERLLEHMMLEPTGFIEERLQYLAANTGKLPTDDDDFRIDAGLARIATEIAVERHSGHLEAVYSPHGVSFAQIGKDLTDVKTLIGTGGIFSSGRGPLSILQGALFSETNANSLRPKTPNFYVDRHYILYAIGLLAEKMPEKALRIGKTAIEEGKLVAGKGYRLHSQF